VAGGKPGAEIAHSEAEGAPLDPTNSVRIVTNASLGDHGVSFRDDRIQSASVHRYRMTTRHFSGWPSSTPVTGNYGTLSSEDWREKLGRLDPPAPGLHADLNANLLEKHLKNSIPI
jgi:hypothetical protein